MTLIELSRRIAATLDAAEIKFKSIIVHNDVWTRKDHKGKSYVEEPSIYVCVYEIKGVHDDNWGGSYVSIESLLLDLDKKIAGDVVNLEIIERNAGN